jgi:hypothetical protein
MPPKGNAPSKKTEAKRQDKVIEDKTFGLKNKNKSKVVQNYVKSVAAQVKQVDGKGGEAKRIADEFAQKAAQKKEEEKKALLASLFKSVKKTQEAVEEEKEADIADEKYEEIDLYVDQREQIWSSKGEDAALDEGLATWHANKDKTDKICKFFLDSVEANKYGWRWLCPNGVTCIYRHALPPGYSLKRDIGTGEEKSDLLLEEQLENERHQIQQGTPVTFERFIKWKEEKKIAREKEDEKKRLEEAKKTGGKGLNVLSGRALFSYDPTLFTDDAEALGDEEYEEEERDDEEEKEDDGIREEGEEEEEGGEEPEGKEWGVAKNDENVKINEDVFLGEDDVELPDDE